MKKNMGLIDRIVRAGLVVLVAVLYLTHQISGTAGVVLGILAVVILLTSVVGVCPAYLPFGLSTRKRTAR